MSAGTLAVDAPGGSEDGSAAVESVFSIFFLMFLVAGIIQVALVLYGRNVVTAAAHEGARSAIELGRNPSSAATIAEKTVRAGAGGIADDISVEVITERSNERVAVRVRVHGRLEAMGPLPVDIPITSVATASRETSP